MLKQLADGMSIHTKASVHYWLALALVSALTVIPGPQEDSVKLPFLSVEASARDFYAFAFILISLLLLGYGSANCQMIRTRLLAQQYIDNTTKKFLSPGDIHIQDILDSIMSPSINRVAPLVQILQGKEQFYTQRRKHAGGSMILVAYFTILRLVTLLAVYVFPGYALIFAFLNSGMSRLSAAIWNIPVCVFWFVGIVAVVVLAQSFIIDVAYFVRSACRIRERGHNQR